MARQAKSAVLDRKDKSKKLVEDNKKSLHTTEAYQESSYRYFQSLNWAELWKEFNMLKTDGTYRYPTAWSFAKDKATKPVEANWLYAAIGPKEANSIPERYTRPDGRKKGEKRWVPYLGDWSNVRQTAFIGEINKDSLLYGNPKTSALREILKTHVDALSTSRAIADLMMDWIARWTSMSRQVDEYFDYQIVKKDLNEKQNHLRFKRYVYMQGKLEDRATMTARTILRCLGIGEDDVNLLAQIMIATMRKDNVLGDEGTKALLMMQMAAKGFKGSTVLDGQELNKRAEVMTQDIADTKSMEEISRAGNSNPTLNLLLSTFAGKSVKYGMEDAIIKDADEKSSKGDNENGKRKANGEAKIH